MVTPRNRSIGIEFTKIFLSHIAGNPNLFENDRPTVADKSETIRSKKSWVNNNIHGFEYFV
jgi:hypothetical protein